MELRYRVEGERWRTLQHGTRIYEVTVAVEVCTWRDPLGGPGKAWGGLGTARGVSSDPYEARARAAANAETFVVNYVAQDDDGPFTGELRNRDLVAPLEGLSPFALTGAEELLGPA